MSTTNIDTLSYDQLKNLYWEKGGARFTIPDTSETSIAQGRDRMLKFLKELESKKQEQDTTPDIKEFKGNRKTAKNIWNILKDNAGLDVDFEEWLSNVQGNSTTRWNIHDILTQNAGLDVDFNTWNQNVFGDTPEDTTEDVKNQLSETALKIGDREINIYGIPVSLQQDINEQEEDKEATDFGERLENTQLKLKNLLKKPILDANGNVDREATIKAYNEIIENYPSGTIYAGEEYGPDGELRPIILEEIDLETPWEKFENVPEYTEEEKETKWVGGLPFITEGGYEEVETKASKMAKNKAIEDAKIANAADYENMLNEMYGKAGFKFKKRYKSAQVQGMYGQVPMPAQLTMTAEAPNGEILTVNFEDFNEAEIKEFIKTNQIHKTEDQVAKEKEAFALWKKGELDIPSTCEEVDRSKCKDVLTLDKIAKPDPSAVAYLRSIAPDMEEIPEDDIDAFRLTFQNTLNKATSEDPRMKFITENIQKEIFKAAGDKSLEIQEMYDTTTQVGLEKAQDAFRDWYNKEFQTKLKDNKQAKQLYQEYGLAGQDFYGQYAREYGRWNYDTWLDDNVLREIDANIGEGEEQGFWSKLRESTAMLPSNVKGMVNKVEVALQEGMEWEKRAKVFESMKEDFDKGTLKRDMTLEQARAMNPEIDEWLKWTIHGWSNDDTLGEFYDTREKRYENTKADMMEDLDEMQEAEMIQSFFNQYHGDSWGDTVASAIQQAPHMAPTMLGSLLIAGGTASAVASGGAATGIAAGAIGTGKILLGVGSAVMAAQTYGDTFIEGTRRQMEEEYGEGGFTTEEYLEALAQEKYGAQLAPLLTAAAVGASEYVGGKLGGELVGTGVASIIKSKTGQALLGRTLSNFIGATAGTYAGMKGGALEEAITEGFQSYLEQVGQNAMNLGEAGDMSGQGLTSAFTENIDLEQIQMEARMGWNMGHLFGIGGLAGTFHGLSQRSYAEQARTLVENIDIQPGSKTSASLEQWFKNTAKKINENKTLTKKQKREQIQELSNIRESALKIPANVKGEARRELMSLLDTQKELKNKIKQTDNKTISEADGTIRRLDETEARMKAIIEQAANEQLNLEQGPTQAQGFLLGETQENVRADDISDADAISWLNLKNKGRQTAGLDVELNTDEAIQEAKQEIANARNLQTTENQEVAADQKQFKGIPVEELQGLDRIDEQLVDISGMVDEGWHDKSDPRYKQHNDLRRRRKKIEKLELENTADELRTKLEKAEGENRENIEIALEEKFKKLPQAVEDSEIDIYTGEPLATDSYAETDALMNNPDFDLDNAFDQKRALKAAAPVIEATLNRLWRPGSLLTRDEFRKALETEYLLTLQKYDEGLDVNLQGPGKQTSNLFNTRAGAIAKENLGKGERASLDKEEAMQVEDTTEQKDFDEAAAEDTQREKVYSSSTDQVQNQDVSETKAVIKDELQKDILTSANQGKNVADTVNTIRKNAEKNWFKELKRDIGTFASQAYKDLINSIDEAFIKSIPAATIKRRFGKLFGIQKISTTPTKQVGKSGKMSYFDKPVYSIPKITKQGLQEFKDYFLGSEKRQNSLYRVLANDFALESISELMTDKDFMQKLETALADSDITAVEFMETLENLLDPRTKEDTSLDVIDGQQDFEDKMGQQDFEDKFGYVPAGRDWLEELALDKGKPSWWYKMSVKENRERRKRISDLAVMESADELRDKIKTAKGEAKTDLILALEEKFEKFPELVEDSEVDIYTGKPKKDKPSKTPQQQKNIYKDFAERKWAEDLQKSKDNINTQFGAGTVATIKPNTKWETFKKQQIEKGIDWDGQIAANDETRMQRDFEAVQRDLKKQQKEAKGREFRKTAPKDKWGRVDTDKIAALKAKEKREKLAKEKESKKKKIKKADKAKQTVEEKFTAIEKAQGVTPWVEMSTVDKAKMVVELLTKLAKAGLGKIISATHLTSRALPWTNTGEQLTITSLARLKNAVDNNGNRRYSDKEIARLEEALEKGELIETSQLRKDLKEQGILDNEMKLLPSTKPQKKLRGPKGIIATIKKNLKDLGNLEKLGIKIRETIKDVLVANPNLLPAVHFAMYQVNNSSGFSRMMAPLVGYINQKGFNQKHTVGEHSLQYGNFVALFTQQALVLSKPEFDYFNKFLSKSYVQIQLGDGNKATWSGSGRKIQDKTYEANSPNLFEGGEVGVKWVGQNQLHPQVQEIVDRVNDPNDSLTWEEVYETMPDLAQVRNFSKYGYYNPNFFMYKGQTMAEYTGTTVPSKYTEVNTQGRPMYPNVVKVQAYAVNKVLTNQWTKEQAKDYVKVMLPVALKQSEANINLQEYTPSLIEKICNSPCKVPNTSEQVKKVLDDSAKTQALAQKANKKKKGISVFDFDGVLADTKENVIVTMPDGTIKKINALEFAEQADQLVEQGAEFDFSEFEKVKGAKKGPLADLALRRQDKFGSGDIYVLTARPQTSASAIKMFLDGIGLNIPLENITGLENGSPQAKAQWVLSKTAEGYNDFYFADDSLPNVKAVKQILDQVDVKSKVQQAIADKAINLDKEFNEIIEETTGVRSQAEYSKTRAKLEGQKRDKGFFKWLGKQLTITPSAEDFLGLMYDLMGYGKQGNRHAQWIADKLIKPFNKAEQQILSAKVAVANDFAALKEAFPSLRSTLKGNPLMSEIGVGPYTKSQAMRVYIWTKQGMDIPGLSKRDQNALVKAVEADIELMAFADKVMLISKSAQYPAPGNTWIAGTIDTDLMSDIDNNFRREVMAEFDENVDIIFSEKNLNKLEAIYGKKWVEALTDSLRRMKSGSNRPVYQGGGARIVNEMLDWLNGSVGAVMFVNMRSGLLQLISNVNFINWSDNNIYAAAKAFASKDYFPTLVKLLNSDYLVNRRDGLKINVNESELADAGRKGGFKGMVAYLLDKGFIITRIMDSLAIASGGATFFINRKNTYMERGFSESEAETKAFDDFYAISEETQQSSNPSKISQQQASLAGRVLLAFQNVTMQYNRRTKKAIRDLYNRRTQPGKTQRESDMSNLSQIVYYTTVQNVIFNALQNTLFAMLFDDETEDKEKNKLAKTANGMLDSLLFGLGFGGAAISTIKNVLIKVAEEHQKKSPDYEEAVWEIFNVSPVLDSKVRKLRTTAKTFSWNMEEIRKRGWSLDNPTYLAVSQLISAATNIPLDRVMRKTMNIRAAMDEETRTWQRIALLLGWDTWSVGLPYWGLESTIKREEVEREKAKKQYKQDIKKLKAMGYKKGKDNGPDVIEVEHFSGVIQYWSK